MAKKWPLAIATYILIPLVKVLSDGGDEVQYQGFCLIFDIDGASSIKIFTLLSIFVWVKLVVPKSDLFLCTVLQPSMSRSECQHLRNIYGSGTGFIRRNDISYAVELANLQARRGSTMIANDAISTVKSTIGLKFNAISTD